MKFIVVMSREKRYFCVFFFFVGCVSVYGLREVLIGIDVIGCLQGVCYNPLYFLVSLGGSCIFLNEVINKNVRIA